MPMRQILFLINPLWGGGGDCAKDSKDSKDFLPDVLFICLRGLGVNLNVYSWVGMNSSLIIYLNENLIQKGTLNSQRQ